MGPGRKVDVGGHAAIGAGASGRVDRDLEAAGYSAGDSAGLVSTSASANAFPMGPMIFAAPR